MKAQHSYLGIPAIVIFTFIPALLWLNIMPLADRFNGTPATLTSLGQLCGLTGLALFAAALILSSRLKLLEPYFGGINRAFIIHHIIGGLAFSLLLVHPVALTIRYMYTSYGSAYRLLFDFADLPVTFGHLALYAMIGLLFVTFFVKLPYHIWKISHQFMGAAFLFAALHTLLISSDVARDGLLRTYMIFVLAVGLAAYDYKTVFGKYLIRKYNYKLVEIKARAQNVIDLVLSPENGNFKFAPGQFAFLAAQNGRLSAEQHPFSVSSAPNETTLTFSIKNLGDYTAALFGNLKPGDQFVVEGPYGRFSHQLSKFNRQVWIGGGIGITPFLSMAKSLDDKYEIDCYYCVKNEAEAVFLADLKNAAARYPKLRIIPYLSETEGRLDLKAIQRISGNIYNTDFFICGPAAMMQSLRAQLVGAKVHNYAIHTEEFSL